AAGVSPGDTVRVAGVDAGRVDAVRQTDGQVEVVMAVDEGVELSGDTAAAVQVETVLGTKFVRLTTGDDWDHPLESGDTITDTTTPVELLDIQNTGTRLFDESDGAALNDLMDSVSQITDGKRVQVRRIIDGLGDLTQAVSDRETEARDLLDSAETLTGTLADRDEELGSAIDNLNVVVGNLAERRAALVDLLESTSAAARQLTDLVGDNRADLDVVLDDVHTTLDTIGGHQVDLAQAVAYLGVAIEGFASIGYNGPQEVARPWGNIFTQLVGPTGPDGVLGACMPVDRMLDLVFGPDPLPCDQRTGSLTTTAGPADGAEPPDLAQPAGGVDVLLGPLLGEAAS
ncbi:MAG TPA: MlaD family protein, partial [Acidimicrobiales bacterium]